MCIIQDRARLFQPPMHNTADPQGHIFSENSRPPNPLSYWMRRRDWIFASGWGALSISGGAVMTSLHLPFRSPGNLAARWSSAPANTQWSILHFLGATCGCSAQVAAHLTARGVALPVFEEAVIFGPTKPDFETPLRQSGFLVRRFPESRQAEADVNGVPAFLVLDQARNVRYSGGYGTAPFHDLQILREIQTGQSPVAIPVLGCPLKRRKI